MGTEVVANLFFSKQTQFEHWRQLITDL